jgi:SBP domain
VCGETKGVLSFGVDHPGTCTSCRNQQARVRGEARVAEDPDQFRMCVGCGVAHKVEEFDGDTKTCRKKLEAGARNDSREVRKDYHQALNEERKRNVAHAIYDKKKSADKRGKAWELTDKQAEKLILSACYYSGIHEPDMHLMGIDRKDNTKGYTLENSVPCHGFVNMMKKEMSVEVFVQKCGSVCADQAARAMLLARYNNAVKNNMKCPLSFDELCGAIVKTTPTKSP